MLKFLSTSGGRINAAVTLRAFGGPFMYIANCRAALDQGWNRPSFCGICLMTLENFRQLADYNHWANRRLYAAALAMPDELYRRTTGVFFGSLHGTLNHLLLTDRVWLKRLTGEGEHPSRLDAILFEDRNALARARMAEDARLSRVVGGYGEADLAAPVSYQTMSGAPQQQPLKD